MVNPYLGTSLSQSNDALATQLCNNDHGYSIDGPTIASLVAIKETLFMERRLSGDTQRDMAQRIDRILTELTSNGPST